MHVSGPCWLVTTWPCRSFLACGLLGEVLGAVAGTGIELGANAGHMHGCGGAVAVQRCGGAAVR
eukprot:7046794-Prymnesium_polylepis.1